MPDEVTGKLCADFQDVAFTHVEDRIKRALDYVDEAYIHVNALVVVGGVAANLELRRYKQAYFCFLFILCYGIVLIFLIKVQVSKI